MNKQPSALEELRRRVQVLEEHVVAGLSYFCRGSVKGLQAGKRKSATRAFTQTPFRGPESIIVAISPTMDKALRKGHADVILTAGEKEQLVRILPGHDTGAFLLFEASLDYGTGEAFSIAIEASDDMQPARNDFDVLVWRRRGMNLQGDS